MATEKTTVEPPSDPLTGKQFEDVIVPRLDYLRKAGSASIRRYGVHANVISRFADGTVRARLIPSQPDFEGVFGRYATQTMFDAKVCSQSSFDLSKYRPEANGARARQLTHMYERASHGCPCFFLIHWNTRDLSKKTIPAATWAFPVHRENLFWEAFDSGMERRIKLEHCRTHGVMVPWVTIGAERTPRPDIMGAVLGVQSKLKTELAWHEC